MTLEQSLRARVDSLTGRSASEVSAALGPIFTQGALATAWLGDRLKDMRQDRPRLPSGFADPVCQSLVMLDHAGVHLSLAIISAAGWQASRDAAADKPDVVGFADGWTTIRFLSAADAHIQRHVLQHSGEEMRAVQHAPQRVGCGHLVHLDNRREALRFTKLGADVILLRLLVRDPDVEQAFECDAQTGAVLRVREARADHGRARMMLSLLRSLGRRDAVPVMAEALAAWPAHLRWHAVCEALATDSIAGFGLLEALAATDPDAGLRALACRTRDDLLSRFPQLAA